MLRKIVMTVFLVSVLTFAAWAQVDFDQFTISSVQAYTSFGQFKNALDGAGNVDEQGMGPGFSELENKYVFGGLSNINRNATAGGGSTASVVDPLTLGLFMPGDLPWSVFSGTYFDSTGASRDDRTELGPANNETVTAGTTDTQYTWYDHTTAFDYSPVITGEFVKYGQFLARFGAINAGLLLGYGRDNDFASNAQYTRTRTYQYDQAAAGEVPNPTTDYTSTYMYNDYTGGGSTSGQTTEFGVELPFYLTTGDLAHTGSLGVTFAGTNASFTQSLDYTVPADNNVDIALESNGDVAAITTADGADGTAPPAGLAAGSNQFVEIPAWGDTVGENRIPIDLNYALYTPLLGEHEDNRMMVGLNAGVDLNSASYSRVETWQLYDFAVGGDPAANTRSEYTQEATIETASNWDAELSAMHSFYYDLGENLVFAVSPSLSGMFSKSVGYDSNDGNVTNGIAVGDFARANGILASTRTVTRTDGTNDGAFDAAGDTITTVDVTYNNAVAGDAGAPQDLVERSQIDTTFGLPMSAKVKPADWNFSVTLGSRPEVQFIRTSFSATTQTTRTDTASEQGDDTAIDVVPDSQRAGTAEQYAYTDWTWNLGADHRIALNLMLPAGVTVDVALDLSTGSFTILDFRNFIVETVIPLP